MSKISRIIFLTPKVSKNQEKSFKNFVLLHWTYGFLWSTSFVLKSQNWRITWN